MLWVRSPMSRELPSWGGVLEHRNHKRIVCILIRILSAAAGFPYAMVIAYVFASQYVMTCLGYARCPVVVSEAVKPGYSLNEKEQAVL